MADNKQVRLNICTTMPVFAGILVIIDRLLKSMAINGCFDQPVNLIGDFFKLSFASNANIAFSLPLSGRPAIIIISLILSALIVYSAVLFKGREYNQAFLLLAVIIGAAGNLFDRIKYGFVVDYFDLKYFTVFNLADVTIILAIAGLFCINRLNKKNS